MMFDHIAYRHARAWGLAIALIPLFIWALWQDNEPSQLLNSEASFGVVEHIATIEGRRHGTVSYYARVRLSNNKTMVIPITRPIPKINDKVPLIRQTYSNGDQYYYFDKEKWMISGPVK